VRAAAGDVFEILAVDVEAWFFGEETLDDSVVGLENFWLDVGTLGAEDGAELDHLLLHPLVEADARVLIGAHAGIDEKTGELLIKIALQLEGIRQRGGRRRKLSLKCAQFGKCGGQFLFRRTPGFV